MDWSPESVLDYGPRVHSKGLRWRQKRLLLWPVWAWRVVVPQVRDRKLNPLQRVVLRFHIAGQCRVDEAAELLGTEPEFVAYIADELEQMGLVDGKRQPTDRASRFLEESELDVGDLDIGWVFQDGFTGKLLPRVASELSIAQCEANENGRPVITAGSKGRAYAQTAVLLRHRNQEPPPPTPRAVLDAARRHRRHARRVRRAMQETGMEAPAALEQVALVSEHPEAVHLLTFVYVPEEADEELPWYVAEPFGFGASPELRDLLEDQRTQASGGLRDLLDGITGGALSQHREQWAQMRQLLCDEARVRLERAFPRGGIAADDDVRERLECAFLEIVRIEQADATGSTVRRDLDAAYLRLRQALECALELAHRRFPPGDAWLIVHIVDPRGGHPKPLLKRDSRAIILACARGVGFDEAAVPPAISGARPGTIRFICTDEPRGRIRPTVAAFLLSAVDDSSHPLCRIAEAHPGWLRDVDRIAEVAGGEVHGGGSSLSLEALRKDVGICISAVRTLLNAVAGP
jgi:hypothetical protein